jgi:hypothetical protein
VRNIEISEDTFKRLRMAARPDETSELVIKRLLDQNEENGKRVPTKKMLAGGKGQNAPPSSSQSEFPDKLKNYEKQLSGNIFSSLSAPSEDDKIHLFQSGQIPHSVTHTKIFEATINNEPVSNSALSWTPLICEILKEMHKNGQFSPADSYPDLAIYSGCRTDKGYKYIPEIECSVQGVDANIALRCITGLARKYSISVTILFGWRDKKGALHRGEFGHIIFTPLG